MRHRTENNERGAVAVIIALSMVLLMGIAAIAIDLGFGFNERRQSQSAADMAVMAGATEVVLGGGQQEVVNNVLTFARANLNITYTDAEWQAMWQNCTDPHRLGFDVGTGTPVDFQPLPEPTAWGNGELECISQVASYLRVRIPDQIIGTTFGRVLGFDSLTTSAAAVALIEASGALGAVLPFGVPAGGSAGELCLNSSGAGQARPPCRGGHGGGFGTLLSQFYGDFFGNDQICRNKNTINTTTQNVALGLDHAISIWPESSAQASNVAYGDDYPSNKNDVRGYFGIGFDDCEVVGGSVVPSTLGHVTPPNALEVLSGLGQAAGPIFDGLVIGGSNSPDVVFEGRLRRGSTTRTLQVQNSVLGLDNKGLWDYLTGDSNTFVAEGSLVTYCNRSLYGGSISDDPAVLEEKVRMIHECLRLWEIAHKEGSNPPVIFHDDIGSSPRLSWVPEFWHAISGSESYQPVFAFRLAFVAGMYLDCPAAAGQDCDIVFYPDESTTDHMCRRHQNGSCFTNQTPTLGQLSAFLVPTEAVPVESRPPIPGQPTAFKPSLFR